MFMMDTTVEVVFRNLGAVEITERTWGEAELQEARMRDRFDMHLIV